jgi:hypothetical protein
VRAAGATCGRRPGGEAAQVGIDYAKKNHPPGADRPIPIVDAGKGVKVLSELL